MRRPIFAAALAFALSASALVADTKPPLKFIEDDYGKAIAQAKSQNVPLFVEAWAPW